MDDMAQKNCYFFDRGQKNRENQLRHIIYRLYEINTDLHEKEIYWSDMKLDNIVLSVSLNPEELGNEGCQVLQIKAIDFGGSSQKFDEFVAFTPGYAPNPTGMKILKKEDRQVWEYRMLGNTLLEMMIKSIFDFIKRNFIELSAN